LENLLCLVDARVVFPSIQVSLCGLQQRLYRCHDAPVEFRRRNVDGMPSPQAVDACLVDVEDLNGVSRVETALEFKSRATLIQLFEHRIKMQRNIGIRHHRS
jgi:hypothetical protein